MCQPQSAYFEHDVCGGKVTMIDFGDLEKQGSKVLEVPIAFEGILLEMPP